MPLHQELRQMTTVEAHSSQARFQARHPMTLDHHLGLTAAAETVGVVVPVVLTNHAN